jgi:diguanylate cyclase (GGDEF)-like protein
MKIDERKASGPLQSAAPATPGRRQGTESAAPVAAKGPVDRVAVMDIPESEFTPKVRAAIMALMAEVDRLRSELQMTQQRMASLEQVADQDTLTPIYNRRAFVRELTRMISFSHRYDVDVSVIYFDVNGLKQVNDTLGHAAGDAVLMRVASILSANVRDSDFVGRLGGDEFGVILAQSDAATTHVKAAQLVQLIADQPIEWKGRSIPVRLSYGTYSFRGGSDPNAALDAADRDMYARKAGARA